MIEGQDFSEPTSAGVAVEDAGQIEPLEGSQAEIYNRAFQGFHEARQNLQSLLIAGGFGNKDIVKAELQGDNPHFVTRPSKNGVSG